MTLIDTTASAARQENRAEINRLEEENASLRAYLDRVLVLLDSELPEPQENGPSTPEQVSPAPAHESVPAAVPRESGPSRLLRLADMERRIKRTEETLEDLVWLVTRLEHDATAPLEA